MYECELCNKGFEKEMSLRGHQITCKKKHAKPEVDLENSEGTPEIEEEKVNYEKYKELPPPMIEHLEITLGDWLTMFEIGQEWRNDFGGYAMYIKVPKEYSTEWKTQETIIYDNKKGKEIGKKKIEVPDQRWVSLKDLETAKSWVDRVKENIITNAYSKGIKLPSTNAQLEQPLQTKEDYAKNLHKI